MKRLLGKGRTGLFATRTLSGHLIRGAVGVALIYVAISQQHPQPGWSMLAGLLSLVALRGCPACWTIGLVEALHQRTRLRQGPVPDADSPSRTLDDWSLAGVGPRLIGRRPGPSKRAGSC
jgi:hypothetical protein